MRQLFFSLVLFPFQLFAIYNGNPSLPMMPETGMFINKEAWLGIKAGYQYDDVYDHRLKMVNRHDGEKKNVPNYDSMTNQGVLTLNFNDRAEVYGSCGSMSFSLKQRPFEGTKVSYHADSHLVWGVGGRAILAYWGNIQVGVNAVYLQADLPLSSLKVNGASFPKHRAKGEYSQWEIGAGVSYRWGWFMPYVGFDYSDFRMKIVHLHSLTFLFHSNNTVFKEVYPMGILLGFGVSPDRGINLNFEARFINENAVSASADFKF